ncbi:hypothetical protein J6590_037878 [Homalodisca vitripennis]|nr:hypothetical protein J6590_037878 [Homalodisca vitripennis]
MSLVDNNGGTVFTQITRSQPSVTRWIGSLQLLVPGSTMADGETFDPSTIYYIYGGESEKAKWEENIYEAIDARDASPHVYDELVEYSTDSRYLIYCSDKVKPAWPTCIPLWMKLCIPLFIFVISMGYLSLSGRITMTVEEIEATKSIFENYSKFDWYVYRSSHLAQCAKWDKFQVVKIQQLQVIGESCYNRDSCLKLISSYENIAGATANYSFYIDAYSDVYGGRGWLCPYTARELWVAVLVDIFPSNFGLTIADKVLVHFTHKSIT